MRRLALLLLALPLAACSQGRQTMDVPGGDPAHGKHVIQHVGCGGCHAIPGIDDASGRVAPSLAGYARSKFIAHALTNTLPNLVRWIENPQRVAPGTRMPSLGVKPADARDIAAYLYRKT